MDLKCLMLLLNLLASGIFAQNGYVLGDTTHFLYTNSFPTANTDVDSVVYVKDYNKRYTACSIYFDRAKKNIAYRSTVSGDTCVIINYFRNGRIKSQDTFVNNGKYNFSPACSDIYCANGQQIVHFCYTVGFAVTRYYCNGRKKTQWTYDGTGAEGLMVMWHENGQKSSEGNWVNNLQEGEWRYWDENGRLVNVINWKEGIPGETR